MGNIGILDGHVDTHWEGASLEKHELRQTAPNYFLGGENTIFCIPSITWMKGQFTKSWGLRPNRLVFSIAFLSLSFFLLAFGSNDSELMIENTFLSLRVKNLIDCNFVLFSARLW